MTREEFIANKQRLQREHDSKLVDSIREQIEDSVSNSKDFSLEIKWNKAASYIDKAIEIESSIYPFLEFKFGMIRESSPRSYLISYDLKEEQASK